MSPKQPLGLRAPADLVARIDALAERAAKRAGVKVSRHALAGAALEAGVAELERREETTDDASRAA